MVTRCGPDSRLRATLGKAKSSYLPKLCTAAVSLSYTSKTVMSLVTCSTSLNFAPRLQSLSVPPCDLALWNVATSVPKPALSMYVTFDMFRTIFLWLLASKPLTRSRKELLSSPKTIRPSRSTTVTPLTSRSVILSATFFASWQTQVPMALPGPADDLSNSPNRTYNIRKYHKSTCSDSALVDESTRDNASKHSPTRSANSRSRACLVRCAASSVRLSLVVPCSSAKRL